MRFSVKFEEIERFFPISFESVEQSIQVGFTDVQEVRVMPSVYDGDYEVTPKFQSQVLSTKGKSLVDDVSVKAISVSRTSNPSGGTTVYIGGIIDG